MDGEMEPARRAGERPQLRRVRKGGWNREKQAVFLRHLAATANVTASAKAVGLTKSAADNLRKRDAAFAQAWQEALAAGEEMLETLWLAHSLGTAGEPAFDEAQIAAGRYPEPPDPSRIDPQFAMEFLKQLRGNRARPRHGRMARMATKTDTARALMTQIDKVRARKQRQADPAAAEARKGGQ